MMITVSVIIWNTKGAFQSELSMLNVSYSLFVIFHLFFTDQKLTTLENIYPFSVGTSEEMKKSAALEILSKQYCSRKVNVLW